MMQRHMLLSVLLIFSFSSTSTMDKCKPSGMEHEKNITRAMDGMLGLIYRHDLTLNDDHTDAERALFNNSKLIRGKYGASYEDVIASKAKLNLPHAIMILMRAPYPVQRNIVQHLNITIFFGDTDRKVWETPLAHMLITRNNLELRSISPRTLRLLDETQFSCMHDVTVRRPRFHKEYFDEDKQDTAFCTPISSAQKDILASLPDQFMQSFHVGWLLRQLICSEKPSALTKYVYAPISMMLHAPRITDTNNFYNPLLSRTALTLLLMWLSLPTIALKHFCGLNAEFAISYFSSAGMQVAGPCTRYSENQKCIVRRPAQFIQKSDLIFGTFTCLNIVGQNCLMRIPLKTIIPGVALALAPFMLYDYCTYGLLYPIKTQSIAKLIEEHKNSPKRSFCTLL